MTTLTTCNRPLIVGLSAIVLLVSGCAEMNDTQRGTAMGAGLGALAGAVIGDSGKSAAIGAGVGALGGYIWSNQMAKKKPPWSRPRRAPVWP